MQAVDNSCFNFILRTRCPYWRAFAKFLFNAFHIGVGLRTNFSMRPAIHPCWRALRTNQSMRRVVLHTRVRLRTKYWVHYLHLVLDPLPCTTTPCRPSVSVCVCEQISLEYSTSLVCRPASSACVGEKFIRHVRSSFHFRMHALNSCTQTDADENGRQDAPNNLFSNALAARRICCRFLDSTIEGVR